MNEPRTAAATRASVRASTAAVFERNKLIVERVMSGEKRWLVAMDYGLTKNSITIITRKAGLPAYSRFKRPV